MAILTEAQRTGLEAAILAHLAAAGSRFARTAAAFKQEAQLPGGIGVDALEVSGAVLAKAWEMFNCEHAQRSSLDTVVLEYLIAEGGRFARTVTMFKEDTRQPGGFMAGVLERLVGGYTVFATYICGAVLEKAWVHTHRRLNNDATQSLLQPSNLPTTLPMMLPTEQPKVWRTKLPTLQSTAPVHGATDADVIPPPADYIPRSPLKPHDAPFAIGKPYL